MLKRISQLASINRLQNWCYIQGDGNKSWWASQLSPGPPSLCSSPSRGTRPNRSLRRADAPPGTSWGLRSAFCSARATPSPRSAPPPALPHSYLAAATMTMTLPHQSVAVVVCSKPSSSSQARFEISSPPVSSPVLLRKTQPPAQAKIVTWFWGRASQFGVFRPLSLACADLFTTLLE